jgi:hypothetical protein
MCHSDDSDTLNRRDSESCEFAMLGTVGLEERTRSESISGQASTRLLLLSYKSCLLVDESMISGVHLCRGGWWKQIKRNTVGHDVIDLYSCG